MKLLMVPIDFHRMEKNKWLPSTVGYQHFSKYLLLCFPIDCWRKINKHFKRSKKNLKECILCHINNIWPLHLKQMDFNFLCIFWYGVNLSLYLCVCVCVCVCVRACVRVCVCVCIILAYSSKSGILSTCNPRHIHTHRLPPLWQAISFRMAIMICLIPAICIVYIKH